MYINPLLNLDLVGRQLDDQLAKFTEGHPNHLGIWVYTSPSEASLSTVPGSWCPFSTVGGSYTQWVGGSYTFALQGSQIEFACGHIIYNIRQPGSQRESCLRGLLSREAGTEGIGASSLSDSDNSTCTNETPLLAH
jgi:hypothetical protein